MTRRGFVGAAFAGTMGIAASSVLSGCSTPKADAEDVQEDWAETADVVVVGAGAGGCAAALEAVQAGASVLLLEKTGILGGDAALCGGILAGYGTRLAKAQGIEVTADEVYEWFTAHPDWFGALDPNVARLNANKCGETIDWLEDLGVEFEKEVGPLVSYTDLPVVHHVIGKGGAMMGVLTKAVTDAGIKTMTDTGATELIMNAEGRVIGIEAEGKKGTIRIKANKGVILTTGGYSGNNDMLAALNPENKNIKGSGSAGVTGDGLAMAVGAGVFTTRTSYYPLLSSVVGMTTKTPYLVDYEKRLYELLLDRNGERFCDEGQPYLGGAVSRAVLRKQAEQDDQEIIALIPTSEALEDYVSESPLEWTAYETIKEAAAAMGLDGERVKATVDRYNGFCAAGQDDDFGKTADCLVPMTGPFYAQTVNVSTSMTTGGIKIDTGARALKLKGSSAQGDAFEEVPGLFAAGEVCEWNCASGWTVLSAMTIGRIAGVNAATETPIS